MYQQVKNPVTEAINATLIRRTLDGAFIPADELNADYRDCLAWLAKGNELAPVEAIRRLVEFTFDHHDRNVDFVRIVSIENIHNAEYVKRSDAIKAMNNTILDSLGVILSRGAEEGIFRQGLIALDVHLLISSFCFYRVSNRHTFGEIFQIDLADDEIKQRHKNMICDAVIRYIRA